MATYKGTLRDRTIELDEAPPYPRGQPVVISIHPVSIDVEPGSPAAILRAVAQCPHLSPDVVSDLEHAIAAGRLPASSAGVFDDLR